MYLFSVLFLAVTMAAALPAGQALESALTAPQVSPSSTRQDLEKGGVCPKIIFIYARGSNEDSNLVSSLPLLPPLNALVLIDTGRPRQPHRTCSGE
jgi:cutinase